MLVEREAERAALERLVEDLVAGRGSVVLLEGAAGSGKTSLLGELRDSARARGVRVLSARGSELEQPFAYGAVRQLLDLAVARVTPERRASLLDGAAVHALRVLDAPGGGDRGGQPEEDLLVLHGLHWLAVNLADEAPLLLVVDDAHWTDDATLRWIAYLARRVDDLPIAVAAAARPEQRPETRARLDELADTELTTTLRPRPLSRGAVAALVEAELREPPDDDFLAAITAATGGNPFYVRELLRTAQEESLKPRAGNAGRLRQLEPERVAASISRRLGALGDHARAVAQALAILESAAPVPLVAAVAGLSEEDTLRAGDALARAGLVHAGDVLDLLHPILRAGVRDRIDLAERARLHVRAAAALATGGGDPERAAPHLLATPAGSGWPASVDGAAILEDAARKALSRGAPGAAVRYLTRALEPGLDGDARARVLLTLARAEHRDRRPEADARYVEAAAAAVTAEARDQVALERVRSLLLLGDFPGAATAGRQALAGTGMADEVRRAITVELQVAAMMDARTLGDVEADVQRLADRALAGERLHPAEGIVAAIALAQWGIDTQAAATQARTALDALPRESGDYGSLVMGGLHALLMTDDLREADERYGRLVAQGAAAGSRSVMVGGLMGQIFASAYIGEVMRTEEHVDSLIGLVDESGGLPPVLSFIFAAGVRALAERDQLAHAEQLLHDRVAPEPWPPLYTFARTKLIRAELELAAGRPQEALAHARGAAEIGAKLKLGVCALPWRAVAAHCLRSLGRPDEGAELARAAVQAAAAERSRAAEGAALVALGVCLPSEEGAAMLREAIAVLEGVDAPLELARAHGELGALLRRGGQRVVARDELREALDRAAALGAERLAAHCREELLAAGARPRRERLAGPQALTAAERRVVDLAVRGATNREIAQTLFLTQKTVETHLSSVYRKLDVTSRHGLADALAPATAA